MAFFKIQKLGTTNVHHKKEQNDTISIIAIATLSAPVSLYQKTKYLCVNSHHRIGCARWFLV